MDIYPLMDIRVPPAREPALIDAMRASASDRWIWQEADPHGRARKEGRFYFRRKQTTDVPAVTVCIRREKAGHLLLGAILPDAGVADLSVPQYVAIVNEFAAVMADAIDANGGLCAIGTSKHTLADHFSPQALLLLKTFCKSAIGSGVHLNDQEKWMAFLAQAHRDGGKVHPDTFRHCLASASLPIPGGVEKLATEYDFAMRLLTVASR